MHADRTNPIIPCPRSLEVIMKDYLDITDPREVAEYASAVRPRSLIYFIPKGMRYQPGQSASYEGIAHWVRPDWAPIDLSLPVRHLGVFIGGNPEHLHIEEGVTLCLWYTDGHEKVKLPQSDYKMSGLFPYFRESLDPEQLHKVVLGTHKVRELLTLDLLEEMQMVLEASPSDRRAAIERQYQDFIRALERAGSFSLKRAMPPEPNELIF